MSATNPTPTINTKTINTIDSKGNLVFDRTSPTSVVNLNPDCFKRNGWSPDVPGKVVVSSISGMKDVVIGRTESFLFHNDDLLETEMFRASSIASTVGDGGSPEGSTEIDTQCGHNIIMSPKLYATYVRFAFVENSTLSTTMRQHFWMNTLAYRTMHALNLTYLATVYIGNGRRRITFYTPNAALALAQELVTLLMTNCGPEAITKTIVDEVWGTDAATSLALGGERGDLELFHRFLTRTSRCTTTYLWHWSNGSNPVRSS